MIHIKASIYIQNLELVLKDREVVVISYLFLCVYYHLAIHIKGYVSNKSYINGPSHDNL